MHSRYIVNKEVEVKMLVEIPEYLIERIKQSLKRGIYGSFENFLIAGLENQLSLENGSETAGAFPTNDIESPHPQESITNTDLSLLSLSNGKDPLTTTPPKTSDLEKWGQPGNTDQFWMWGQINKLLPIKFALRILANTLAVDQEWTDLSGLYEKTSKLARQFGQRLSQEDIRLERARGERLSSAFPIGKSTEKSSKRFCTQFIGYIRKDGLLGGGPPYLRFIKLKRDRNGDFAGITRAGLDFANLENPVFDQDASKSNQPFSDAEVRCYLSHIVQHVPGEHFAFKSILQLIDKGVKKRVRINRELKKIVDKSWIDQVINTQRAGAMSRLFELGLISKEKNGVSVIYSITNSGKSFLSAHKI